MRIVRLTALVTLLALRPGAPTEAGPIYQFTPSTGGPPLASIEFASPPAVEDQGWSTNEPSAIVALELSPDLFPGPDDLRPSAPVRITAGFNVLTPIMSDSGTDLSQGIVTALFVYEAGSLLVDGGVTVESFPDGANIFIARRDPSPVTFNTFGQFALREEPEPGPAPVRAPPSVLVMAIGCLAMAASGIASRGAVRFRRRSVVALRAERTGGPTA